MDKAALPALAGVASLRDEDTVPEFAALDTEAIAALPSSGELAAQIVEALKAKATETDLAIDEAYATAAHYHNVRLEPFWVREKLEPRFTVIRYDLELGRIPFHKARLPQTHRILEILELDFRSIEKYRPLDIVRREILDLIDLADDPMDRRTAVRIREAFDEVVSECIQENRLHITRHDYALNWLKAITEARRLSRFRAHYLRPRDPKDFAGKIIQRLISDSQLTADEADNLMLGPFPAGPRRISRYVVSRLQLVFEDDHAAWAAVRALAVRRIAEVGPESGPRLAVNNYPELLELLFDRNELGHFQTLSL